MSHVHLEGPVLADSTCTADVPAAASDIDVSEWLFTLRDDEYRACSAVHLAAGSSRTPDGRRMSINVERPGGTLLVQHYVEDASSRDRCRVVSLSDALTPMGPSTYGVAWTVRVEPAAGGGSTFFNQVRVVATKDFLALLAKNGVPLEAAAANAQQVVDAHNAEETPLFAANLAAKARTGAWRGG
jgi:hypothetical protein